MVRLIATLCLSAMTCLGLASASWWGADASQAKPGKELPSGGVTVRVLWTVSGYKRTPGAAWSEDQAKAMLFKPLHIDGTSITFDCEKCDHISFERKAVEASQYLKTRYRVTPQWLGIEDGIIRVIETNCHVPGFSEYMHLNDRRLVVFVEGVFFFFELNVNY
jgi:hypothetical protein